MEKGEMQQRIWNALRWHKGPIKRQTLLQLIGAKSGTGNVEKYLKLLMDHGYVRKVGYGQYQMVRHTGALAPHLASCLYDPNLKRFVEGKDER